MKPFFNFSRLLFGLLIVAAEIACGGDAPPASASITTVETLRDPVPRGELALPARRGSIRFAVIGDSGRGSKEQYEIGRQMSAYHERFDFAFVLMLGDNIYEGRATPKMYEDRFEKPYRALLERGVTFHAVLGNHDDPAQRNYANFNMRGHPYYTFERRETGPGALLGRKAQFFAIDSTGLDGDQLQWLQQELSASDAEWKICMFHHPLYSSGRYGRELFMRRRLEPVLVRNGVHVVLSGHEHFYERLHPQRGVHYFTSGGAGSIREADINPSSLTAAGYDRDLHFMLFEISGKELWFQAINRVGDTIDGGVIRQK